MFFDDLPLWGYLGKLDDEDKQNVRFLLFTHLLFEVFYNQDRVIEIVVTPDDDKVADITQDVGSLLSFTYSVKWQPTNKTYDERLEKYQKSSLLPENMEIHWFSIVNSCVTVLLLTGFLATILMRVLKNDFVK
jgi:transmembrane 9 superfamily protein 1